MKKLTLKEIAEHIGGTFNIDAEFTEKEDNRYDSN